jgi:hypothetical protein
MFQQHNKLECLPLIKIFSGQYILVEHNISSNDNCPTANIIQKFTLPMAQQQQNKLGCLPYQVIEG